MKKLNYLKERRGFDDIDGSFDDTPFREIPGAESGIPQPYEFFHEEEEEEEEDPKDVEFEDVDSDEDDAVEHLLSTLRKIVRNSGFRRSYVFYEKEESSINIEFILNKTENMTNVMNVMNLLKKLEKDILIQYRSEFDLWETKQGDPILTGKFYYDEDVDPSSDDDDDDDESDHNEEDFIPPNQRNFGSKSNITWSRKDIPSESVVDAESELGGRHGNHDDKKIKGILPGVGEYPPF